MRTGRKLPGYQKGALGGWGITSLGKGYVLLMDKRQQEMAGGREKETAKERWADGWSKLVYRALTRRQSPRCKHGTKVVGRRGSPDCTCLVGRYSGSLIQMCVRALRG